MRRRTAGAAAVALAAAIGLTAPPGAGAGTLTADTDQQTPTYVPDEPLPEEPVPPQQALDELGISGYPSKLSVQPGESVQIMASTKAESFDATMVRIHHGDPDPKGPGIKEEVVDSAVNGTYDGQHQPLPLGSYVQVRRSRALRADGSFTITAFVAPTTIPGSPYNRLALQRTPVGTPRPQGLITKWSQDAERGYGLFIDEQGSIALRLGDGRDIETISTGVKLKPWAPAQGGQEMYIDGDPRPQHANNSGWYFVAASYNARSGKTVVMQQPMSIQPDGTAKTVQSRVDQRVRDARTPVLMAGYWGARGDAHPTGFYNGKIESPRIYDQALPNRVLRRLSNGASGPTPAAAWDLSRRMHTQRVTDTGPNRLHGRAVNLPVRALTSHDWDTKTMNYNQDPGQWGSMYFHQDDLGDARWEPAFEYTVPEDAESGIYAARLEAGDDVYHATFVVTADEPQSKIAMLVPTLSYLAYGRTGGTMSQYSDHADGSGYVYSSAKRPIENLRPYATGKNGEGRPWQFEADTHIFDWLNEKGYDVDFITDHQLDREGQSLLDPYTTVLTASHPEYISTAEMNAFKGWLNDGGRMMYLGGNGFYWVTSLDRTGTYTELRRHDGTEAWQAAPGEYYHSTTGEYGGLWRFRGRPPQELVGVGFSAQGFNHPSGTAMYNVPFDRTKASRSDAASWIFDGVDKEKGIGGDMPTLQSPGGPMGEEVDRVDYVLGTPANAIVVGTSQPFGDEYMQVVEEINTSAMFSGGSENPFVRGDVTLVYYPNGGAVFSAASMVWSGGFFHNDYDNNMTRITENVLDKFSSGEPLPGAP